MVAPPRPDWRIAANARIEEVRKSNLTLRVEGGDASGLQLHLTQVSHDFPFGMAVRLVLFPPKSCRASELQSCLENGVDGPYCQFVKVS